MEDESKKDGWTVEFINSDGLSSGKVKSKRTFREIIESYIIYSQKQKEDEKGKQG